MRFSPAYVKSVKADIAKKEITFSFTVDFSSENIEEAEALSKYIGEGAGAVQVLISPRQMSFLASELSRALDAAQTTGETK